MSNPFPGLRPFEADEDHLFFGREDEVDDLLRRLRTARLIAVVGTSGSGKSSLVRSGLIPALHSGSMASAGSSWRIAIMRPGEDPIRHLAAALATSDVLSGPEELAGTNEVVVEVTLRRSTLGLIDAVKHARLPAGENILVIVDQFEELFRFRASRESANRDEAINFVRLLLAAASQRERPIYIVLTMRSDFIGDCMNFPGLPEAVNAGLFLVGRMSREGLRAAITGPVAVAGGTIAPRLVNRVLNDLGDDHDQLPLVQHALMRTWDHWNARSREGPIDVADYVAIGTFREALSKHAEEAFAETVERGLGDTAERVFKALTDRVNDQRGVRRPTQVGELAAIAEAAEAQVIEVVDRFRAPGRSFLTPPARVALSPHSIVDISHESLMRCWGRLIDWAEEERAAAAFYVRLSQAAAWFDEGAAGVWRNPELELAVRWREENDPTRAWAERYGVGLERAIRFLDRSVAERDRAAAALERERRAKLRRTQAVAAGLATLLIAAVGFGWFAWSERQRAAANLALARGAVDESLAAVDRDPALVGADVPQVEELRSELLSRAERFYLAFIQQDPRSEEARRDLALAHLRVARISRMLDKRDDAEREYQTAIAMLSALAANGSALADRQSLATAYNSLGETLRVQTGRTADAAAAYEQALRVQEALVSEQPSVSQYQEDLALTRVNRGILRWESAEGAASEADFREAIRLLDAVGEQRPRTVQERGRANNNLAALLDAGGDAGAEAYYARAVSGHESLVQRFPQNREYQLELAKFCNNLAVFQYEHGAQAAAAERNRQAVVLLTQLSRPAPSLEIEHADAHNLRGMILQAQSRQAATRAYEEALDQFAAMSAAPTVLRMPALHQRFGDLLINLAQFAQGMTAEAGTRLLTRAIDLYAAVAARTADGGDPAQARAVLETINRVMPELALRERQRFVAVQERLDRVAARGPS